MRLPWALLHRRCAAGALAVAGTSVSFTSGEPYQSGLLLGVAVRFSGGDDGVVVPYGVCPGILAPEGAGDAGTVALLTPSAGPAPELVLALFGVVAQLSQLSSSLVSGTAERIEGLGRFERTERLAAAHAVIVVAPTVTCWRKHSQRAAYSQQVSFVDEFECHPRAVRLGVHDACCSSRYGSPLASRDPGVDAARLRKIHVVRGNVSRGRLLNRTT